MLEKKYFERETVTKKIGLPPQRYSKVSPPSLSRGLDQLESKSFQRNDG